jgi:hypothetical protein
MDVRTSIPDRFRLWVGTAERPPARQSDLHRITGDRA